MPKIKLTADRILPEGEFRAGHTLDVTTGRATELIHMGWAEDAEPKAKKAEPEAKAENKPAK